MRSRRKNGKNREDTWEDSEKHEKKHEIKEAIWGINRENNEKQ